MDFAFSLQLNAAFLGFFKDCHSMGPPWLSSLETVYKSGVQEALPTWPWTALV